MNNKIIKKINKEKIFKNLTIFWAYFKFLFKIVIRHFTNWLIYGQYLLLLLLVLIILPIILNTSPVIYWNNPLILISTFIMPIAAIFASCISLDLFRDGVDSGAELIIISKPISRINFVFAKFTLLLLILLFYGITSSFVGLFTYAVPEMSYDVVGDLVLGLFVGTFVNGVLFGAFAILLSMRFGKNSTNMIVILIALLFDFLTPLSRLFFATPTQIMNDEGIFMSQKSIKNKKTNDIENVVFQVTSLDDEYVDLKKEYEHAESRTFYNNSFYLNIGNMINSLYNLGKLAAYNNANINIAPNNTKWNFIKKIDDNYLKNYDYVKFALSEKIYLSLLLLPTDNDFFWSYFSFQVPNYTFIENKNEKIKVVATKKLYEYNDEQKNKSLKYSFEAVNEILNENNKELQKQLIDAIKGMKLDEIQKVFQKMLDSKLTNIFKQNFEEKFEDKTNNRNSAQNLFRAKVGLFYALETLRDYSSLSKSEEFIEKCNDFISNFETNDNELIINSNWNKIDEYFKNNLDFYCTLKKIFGDANKNKLIAATILIALYNNYCFLYLHDLFMNNKYGQKDANNIVKYNASLGLQSINKKQFDYLYMIKPTPIIHSSIIVLIMMIISFSLFVGIGIIYYNQDIR